MSARNVDRFYSEQGICDSRAYARLASMDRARVVRREVLQFGIGMVAGVVMLLVAAATWN